MNTHRAQQLNILENNMISHKSIINNTAKTTRNSMANLNFNQMLPARTDGTTLNLHNLVSTTAVMDSRRLS